MTTVGDFCSYLEQFAPVHLAADWDNVGLLLGDRSASAAKVMTCLTVTDETVQEALSQQAELIITHHPFPFSPIKKISTDTWTGKQLWHLASAGISVYSPHTAFDSAREGINQQLAEGLHLTDIQSLEPFSDVNDGKDESQLGAGRVGCCEPTTLVDLADRLKAFLGIQGLQMVGDESRPVDKVGIACGSAGDFVQSASRHGCDVFITGEARFHTSLEAFSLGLAMLLPGHFASERFAMDIMAEQLQQQFTGSVVWASKEEADPLRWL